MSSGQVRNRKRRSSVRAMSRTTQRRVKPEPKPAVTKFINIIFIQTIKTKMMKVPEDFVKFGPKFSDSVTLETPVGFKRSIRIKRIGDQVWFEKGWSEFAEAHSLNQGHLLMFQYKENSSFSVVIFDLSASEIDYPVEKVSVTESLQELMGDKKGFTRVVNLDEDNEILKKKSTMNIKSEEVVILDDDEETD